MDAGSYTNEPWSYVNKDEPVQEFNGRMVCNNSILRLDGMTAIKHRNLRPHSTPATLLWLEENYETAEGVCIPRNTLYVHYVEFCAKNYMQPVNAASFGKIIRQQFPQLTTRRLGTRGQSRYHYYGIAIRESSHHYQLSFSKKGANGGEHRRDSIRQVPVCSNRTRTTTVLPEFPRIKELNLPPSVDVEKMSTFLMMYRTHCQRLLDTIIRGSFDEVQSFLLHFWQGMPPHLFAVLESNALVSLVGVCDIILYRTISNVLLPSMLQTFPENATKVVRKFAEELDNWLKAAIHHLPEALRIVKIQMASRFTHILRRQMSLNHLAQASRMVVHNSDITSQMLHDWRQLDLDSICRETLFSSEHDACTSQLILKFSKEFQTLLEFEAPIENYIEWLELLVNKCVVQVSCRRKGGARRLARQFLLLWSAYGTRVIRDMTLHSAASFGSFHLLRLMFDDYVLFLVESIHTEDQIKEFMRSLVEDMPPYFSSLTDYESLSTMENESVCFVPQQSCQNYTPCEEPYSSALCSTQYEEMTEEEEDQPSSWLPGDSYQSSFYQGGGNYDNRKPWTGTSNSKYENKSYNYQQTAQYVILSQDGGPTGRQEPCRTQASPDYEGCYGSSNRQEEGLLASVLEHGAPSSIMYTAAGAIYQSYTLVTHDSPPEKLPAPYREKSPEKQRVHHHVTLRMDGTLYCDG